VGALGGGALRACRHRKAAVSLQPSQLQQRNPQSITQSCTTVQSIMHCSAVHGNSPCALARAWLGSAAVRTLRSGATATLLAQRREQVCFRSSVYLELALLAVLRSPGRKGTLGFRRRIDSAGRFGSIGGSSRGKTADAVGDRGGSTHPKAASRFEPRCDRQPLVRILG
jgi:hypothetical protein